LREPTWLIPRNYTKLYLNTKLNLLILCSGFVF
jgi:hypothetical protein